MKNETTHTPTPWIFDVGTMHKIRSYVSDADVHYIIRAVNSHEELIGMITKLREAFYIKGTSKDVREAFLSINDRFKEIAKAEGK